MANSIHKGYILVPSTAYEDNRPMDTSYIRDGIINNASHLADEAGQQRINYVAESGNYLDGDVDVSATTTYTMIAPFGPFPLSVRSDGSSYRLVVRIRGFTVTGNCTVRAVLAPSGSSVSAAQSGTDSFVCEVTASSTTDGWLSQPSPTSIYLNAEKVVDATRNVTVYNATSRSSPSNTNMAWCYLFVYFVPATNGNRFRLTGLHAREFVGT